MHAPLRDEGIRDALALQFRGLRDCLEATNNRDLHEYRADTTESDVDFQHP